MMSRSSSISSFSVVNHVFYCMYLCLQELSDSGTGSISDFSATCYNYTPPRHEVSLTKILH